MSPSRPAIKVALIALAFAALGYFVFASSSQVEAARRTIVRDGELYRASDVFGTKRISGFGDEANIRLLFAERNGTLLVGRGFEGGAPQSELQYGTWPYLVNDDGTDERQITDRLVTQAVFDTSDDSRVFYLTREGEIYRYDDRRQSTERLAREATYFDIAPDARRLVYLKAPPGWTPGQYYEGTPGLAILDVETGQERLLTPTPPWQSGLSNDYSPLWTPDGQQVIFFNNGLWIINSDGTERTQLTHPGDGTEAYGISDDPLWSSDGRYFLYHADYDIMLVELDIPHKKVVSAGPIAHGVAPQWVEEGKTISVLSPDARAGAPAISIIDLSGNVIRGDRSHLGDFRGKIFAPIPVAPPPPPPSPREITPDMIIWQSPDFNPETTSKPRQVTPDMVIWYSPDSGMSTSTEPREITPDMLQPIPPHPLAPSR